MVPDLIVFGDALVDRFADRAVPGGAPFNVARHLAGLGFAPLMITRVGNDHDGDRIVREFERFAMTIDGMQIDIDHPTGAVDVVESPTGHAFEILRDRAYDYIEPDASLIEAQRGAPSPLYFGTLAQRAQLSRHSLASWRAASDAPTFLDLNWRDGHVDRDYALELLASVDTLKLNDDELRMVLAWFDAPGDTSHASPREGDASPQVAALMERIRVTRVSVTAGAQGYAAFDRAGTCIAAGSATASHIIDTVGAGDAFSAIALAGMIAHWPLAAALERASEFAAAVCSIRGAVPAASGFHDAWRERWGLGPKTVARINVARTNVERGPDTLGSETS